MRSPSAPILQRHVAARGWPATSIGRRPSALARRYALEEVDARDRSRCHASPRSDECCFIGQCLPERHRSKLKRRPTWLALACRKRVGRVDIPRIGLPRLPRGLQSHRQGCFGLVARRNNELPFQKLSNEACNVQRRDAIRRAPTVAVEETAPSGAGQWRLTRLGPFKVGA